MGFIADIFTADKDRKAQTKAADRAADISQRTSDQQLDLQRSMFDRLWSGTQVQRDAGDAATRMMSQLMGLSLPPSNPAQTQPGQAQPAQGQSMGGQPAMSQPRNALMADGEPYGVGGGMTFPQQNMMGEGNALGMPGAMNDGRQVQPTQPGTMPAATGAIGAAPANALDPTAWLRSTPGYQFNLDGGMRSLNAGLAGQGRLQSGDAQREAVRYGQNYNDRIYADQFNRLAGIAGSGQTAQSQGQQAGTNFANAGTNILGTNANNQTASSYARGNATSGFWGNVAGSINNYENMALRFMGGR